MKPRRWLPLGITLLGTAAIAGAVQLGDTRPMVITEMGAPTGEIDSGTVTVLFFPRGEIRLRDGVVSAIDLVSETELAAQQAALSEELARLEAARAERNRKLEAEGWAELEARKNDPAFMQLSAAEQLAAWRTFAVRYPMIPIADELAALRERFVQEQRLYELEVANEQRMAELEKRLAETEERAERAERLARNRPSPWFPRFPGPGRPRRPHDPPVQPEATPPADDLRAKAMSDYEEARREIYSQSDARP